MQPTGKSCQEIWREPSIYERSIWSCILYSIWEAIVYFGYENKVIRAMQTERISFFQFRKRLYYQSAVVSCKSKSHVEVHLKKYAVNFIKLIEWSKLHVNPWHSDFSYLFFFWRVSSILFQENNNDLETKLHFSYRARESLRTRV